MSDKNAKSEIHSLFANYFQNAYQTINAIVHNGFTMKVGA